MSDLNPRGVKIELGGQERKLLFTLNAVDEIQTKCNMALFDAVKFTADAADGKMDHDTLVNFRTITTILLNCNNEEELTEKEVGDLLDLENYKRTAWAVLNAYGISLPDPDEDDAFEDEEDEEKDPNTETGR